MKTKENSIVKSGFKEAFSRFKIVSMPLSFFAVLSILVLALGFYVPLTLIFTIPFVIIPAFFSVSAINTLAPNKNTHEVVGFFVMFRGYFSPIFRGGYRVIIGFLKAVATFIVISVILTSILTTTILSKDPAYIELQSITDPQKFLDAFNNFVSTNENFNNIMTITYMGGSIGFFVMFIHHFAVNSFKYNYNFLAKLPLPMHDLNLINKEVMHKNRKSFIKEYAKAFWFVGLILVVSYVGGMLLSYFFIPGLNANQFTIVGLFAALIIGLFFIPYFLNASQLIFLKLRPHFIDSLIDLSKKSLAEMKKAKQISEDKEKEVMNIIEAQKEEENGADINNKVD